MLAMLPLLFFALAGLLMAQDGSTILQQNCSPCHGAAIQTAGLDLRTREGAIKGGSRGAALVPGKPEESRIYRLAARLDEPHMPPGRPLSAEQLNILKTWIASGAEWSAAPVPSSDANALLAKLEDRPIQPKEREWWAFRKVSRPAVPAGKANAIDAFLSQKWMEKGLVGQREADRRTLIRRAYLDVLGLPPTVEEVNAFLRDTSPKAWETVVDRLLASPHYGERWARHWMDLARYADSGGYEYDRDRDNAWRYRDYLTRSFNEDKPYDRMLQEQLAGDEMWPESAEARIATGYLRLGPENNIKNEQTRLDELDDVVATTSNSLLAMTVGCARCHNHKFDPIPQKDYYRIQAVFWPSSAQEYPLVDEASVAAHKQARERVDKLQAPLKQESQKIVKPYKDTWIAEKKSALPEYLKVALATPLEQRSEGQKLNVIQIEKTLEGMPEGLTNRFSAADKARYDDLQKQIALLEKERPKTLPTAMSVTEKGREATPSYFLHRGSQKGTQMTPGVLSVATESEWPFPEPAPNAKSSERRKNFALWVTNPANPLTPRVMVNRIWQHHFGEGLVRTPNNFGKMGERPSHPELLDWLASEFMAQGWRMKPLHRMILMSETYRMSSDDLTANLAKDPDNRFVWRMPRRRLEGEAIRDSVLAVAGSLNRTVGGEPVFPYIDPSLFQASSKRTWNGRPDTDTSTWRRSLYVFSKRSIPLPMLEVFDKPDTIGSCARRSRSTVAPQALILMNNSFMALHSQKFAEKLKAEAKGDTGRLITLAFEQALGRQPTQTERERTQTYLQKGDLALEDFCHALFNLNEFVYIL